MDNENVLNKKTDNKTDLTINPQLKLRPEFNKGLSKFRQQVKAPSKNGSVSYKNTKFDYVLLDDLIKSIDAGIKELKEFATIGRTESGSLMTQPALTTAM